MAESSIKSLGFTKTAHEVYISMTLPMIIMMKVLNGISHRLRLNTQWCTKYEITKNVSLILVIHSSLSHILKAMVLIKLSQKLHLIIMILQWQCFATSFFQIQLTVMLKHGLKETMQIYFIRRQILKAKESVNFLHRVEAMKYTVLFSKCTIRISPEDIPVEKIYL